MKTETIYERIRRMKYEFFGAYGLTPNALIVDQKTWYNEVTNNGRKRSESQIAYERDVMTNYYDGMKVFILETSKRTLYVGLV